MTATFRSQASKCILWLALAAAVGLAKPAVAIAGADSETLWKGLESLSSADREKTLIDGAKKEGSVVWYTTDGPTPTQEVLKAFSKKYPFVKPGFIRAKSQDVLDRIKTEARAGRNLFDIAKTSSETFGMYPVEVFAAYNSPEKAAIPMNMRGQRWASVFTFVRGIGYNTNLLKPTDLPKTWEDLLDSRWKGKILFDPSSLPEVMTLYSRWGMDKTAAYLDKLGNSGNLQLRDGRTTITQLLSAGEAPLGVTVYPYDVEALKRKGAPIDWALIDPTPGLLQPISISSNAPHPYSAALLYDFLLSDDGQKAYAAMGRTPANPKIESSGHREQAAVNDPRLVFSGEMEGRDTDALENMLNEKIVKKAFGN
jgi:iron(III) transport system substrate-binding protein